jgi:hypothetical protein
LLRNIAACFASHGCFTAEACKAFQQFFTN